MMNGPEGGLRVLSQHNKVPAGRLPPREPEDTPLLLSGLLFFLLAKAEFLSLSVNLDVSFQETVKGSSENQWGTGR